jgi:hypothetical protein
MLHTSPSRDAEADAVIGQPRVLSSPGTRWWPRSVGGYGAILLALGALHACAAAEGGRWLPLDHDEVHGLDRICFYGDALGEVAVTIHSWERCEPSIESE